MVDFLIIMTEEEKEEFLEKKNHRASFFRALYDGKRFY